ncbi:MAG: response regulator [Candidatus Ancaeobacter aquaticus]|nr:response regulator [Candidatus Ancaeobacter aquaticus]
MVTPLIRKLAQVFNIYDKPGKGKIHTRSVPLWGGIAVFIPFVLSIVLTRYYSNPLKAIVYGSCVALLVGIIDDLRKGLSGTIKFIILVLLTILLAQFGVILKIFPAGNIFFYIGNLTLTILWIVGVTSAFNAIDNMDGLSPGVAFIASFFFTIVAIQTQQWWFGMLSIALAGSCLGFLRYNFRPATIFLGDAGSFFIGFLLGSLSVMGEWNTNPFISITIPVFILGIPIFDILFTVISRHYHKVTKTFREALKHCAQDHLSHRLVAIGLKKHHAVLVIYMLAICTGICALVLRNSTSIFDSILLLILGSSVLLIILGIMTIGTKHLKEKYRINKDLEELKLKFGILPDKTNILVVDNEKNIRDMIKDLFSSKGYNVYAASTGKDALKAFNNTNFDLVFLDIVLPGGIDGIDILRQIKNIDDIVPVIIMTGHSNLRTEIDELKYDAFAELKKPFDLNDLEEITKRALKDTTQEYLKVLFKE